MQNFFFGGNLSGNRISRQPWWQIVFFGSLLISILLMYAEVKFPFLKDYWFNWLFCFIFLISVGYVTIKRFHDRGKSGWFSLLFIVPYIFSFINIFTETGRVASFVYSESTVYFMVSIILKICLLWWLIECGFLRGTQGENKFGNDPLEVK